MPCFAKPPCVQGMGFTLQGLWGSISSQGPGIRGLKFKCVQEAGIEARINQDFGAAQDLVHLGLVS